MSETGSDIGELLAVEVEPDGMRAWLNVRKPDEVKALQPEEVREHIVASKIAVTKSVEQQLEEFMKLMEGNSAAPKRFLLAEGRAPREGKDAEFTWLNALGQDGQAVRLDEDAQIDFYTINTIHTVDKDEVFGKVTPITRGRDGRDVFGKPVVPRRRLKDITLGENLAYDETDKTLVKALAPGRVDYKNNSLSLAEILDIKGDVDFESGSIDSSVDVNIKGTVRDEFHVKSSKSINIRGAIEASYVEAAEDIVVRGGILTRNHGEVRAGRQIVAKFCEDSILQASDDIKIARAALNSNIFCKGMFIADRGSIIGGEIVAAKGMEVAVLGSEAGVPTSVVVGDKAAESCMPEKWQNPDQYNAQQLESITKQITSYFAMLDQLSDTQRQRLNRLMDRVKILQNILSTQDLVDKPQKEEDSAAKTGASVLVNKVIHEGTSIRINNWLTSFHKDLKGPVRIERRKVNNVTEFVAVNQLTGSVNILPSRRIEAEAPIGYETGTQL